MKRKITCLFLIFFLISGCSPSVQPIGRIGPKKLSVYAISNNDFLSGSRMLVILDERGNVAAYSGGTVTGGGTVALQTAGTLASASAIVLGAQAIQHGLEHAHGNINGIPDNVDVKIGVGLDSSH